MPEPAAIAEARELLTAAGIPEPPRLLIEVLTHLDTDGQRRQFVGTITPEMVRRLRVVEAEGEAGRLRLLIEGAVAEERRLLWLSRIRRRTREEL